VTLSDHDAVQEWVKTARNGHAGFSPFLLALLMSLYKHHKVEAQVLASLQVTLHTLHTLHLPLRAAK
jgi:hypothetical protein